MSCRLKQATNTVRKGVDQYNAKMSTHTASVPEMITFAQAADPSSSIYSCISVAGPQVILIFCTLNLLRTFLYTHLEDDESFNIFICIIKTGKNEVMCYHGMG